MVSIKLVLMRVPALPLVLAVFVTGTILIVVLILLTVLIGIKLKPLRVGLVVDYQVRQNGSMLPVVVAGIGSILGEMNQLLVLG